jgi:hypothetical protein
MRAGNSDSELTENELGTGPATPVSPAHLASENREEGEKQPAASIRFMAVATELTGCDLLAAEIMSAEEEGSPELEILLIFRRKITGMRRLPRQQRAQAIRAALEWMWSTMAALREKRAYGRHRRHIIRQFPTPE